MLSVEEFRWPDDWAQAIPTISRMVRSLCRQRGLSEADVDDSLQLVLTRITVEAAARKRHFPSVPELCGWAREYLRSQLGKRRRRLELLTVAAGVDVAVLPSKPDRPKESEPIAVYLAMVEDPKEQNVLFLLYVESLKYREVAELLGVTISSVQKLHERALGNLRRRLEA